MNNGKYYVGFPTSEKLSKNANSFFELAEQRPEQKQNELLSQVLCQLSQETIDVYLMDLFKSAGVNKTQSRIINSADSIIKKTANTVIKQTTKKLDAKQQFRIAEHIKSSFLTVENVDNHKTSLIVYSVSDTMYNKLINDHDILKSDSSAISTTTIIENQTLLMDKMLENQVDSLINTIKLGPILKKIVRVAIDKCEDMMKSTHKKLVSNMSHEELVNANQHYIEMLLKFPNNPVTD